MILDKATVNQSLEQIIKDLEVPESKYESAEKSYKSVGEWLGRDESSIRNLSPTVYVQGSFALGTAIKPIADDDHYDIDAVCEIDWDKNSQTQAQLKQAVGREIQSYANRYRMESPEEGRRCWTLNYADSSQFHMDILPATPDGHTQTRLLEEVYNIDSIKSYVESAISITDNQHHSYSYLTENWLGSNPSGYKKWFSSRSEQLSRTMRKNIAVMESYASVDDVPDYKVKLPLQKAIQVLKRHRDIMFADDEDGIKPISIIITTLAAKAYRFENDVLSCLEQIVMNMEHYIEDRNGTKWVMNPVDPRENFADKWAQFPERQTAFYQWLGEVKKDFAKINASSSLDMLFENAAPVLGYSTVTETAKKSGAVKTLLGKVAPYIPPFLSKASHRQAPIWPVVDRYSVTIASAIERRKGSRNIEFHSNSSSHVQVGSKIMLTARTNVPRPYKVYWQVVNTGQEAAADNKLRGDIFAGVLTRGRLKHEENARYVGSHSVECFIVQNGTCVARSGQFIVNIG